MAGVAEEDGSAGHLRQHLLPYSVEVMAYFFHEQRQTEAREEKT
jgi:hypothetical protein